MCIVREIITDPSAGKFFPVPFWNSNVYGFISLNVKIFFSAQEGILEQMHLVICFLASFRCGFWRQWGICQLYDLSVS